MTRKLKPQEIETFNWKGVEVMIYLDRNTLKFFGEYNKEKFEFEAFEQVKTALRQAIEKNQNLEWIPVICINYSKNPGSMRAQDAYISFDFDRFYYARRQDGKMLRTDWALYKFPDFGREKRPEPDRNNQAQEFHWNADCEPFVPPCNNGRLIRTVGNETPIKPYRDEPSRYYVPYTDETWEGLKRLEAAIVAIRSKLAEILTTSTGIEQLTIVGAALMNILPATISKAEPV
jgi:hypothetical protein